MKPIESNKTKLAAAFKALNENRLSEASRLLRELSTDGCAEAQVAFADMLWQRDGVKEDEQEALKWCRLAAEHGHLAAQTKLGYYYRGGITLPANPREAARWTEIAAVRGDAEAQLNLGNFLSEGFGRDKDDRVAAEWYAKAAEQGNMVALQTLCHLYADGIGVLRDRAKALAICERLASSTRPFLKRWAAVQFANGRDVPRDNSRAVRLFEEAAGGGDALALCGLAVMYWNGRGVPKDRSLALTLYEKAAKAGEPFASMRLTAEREDNIANPILRLHVGECYRRGVLVPEDLGEAVRWLQLVADKGFSLAQLRLGDCYASASFRGRRLVLALMWYTLASTKLEEALSKRNTLRQSLTPDEVTAAEVGACDWRRKRNLT